MAVIFVGVADVILLIIVVIIQFFFRRLVLFTQPRYLPPSI